MIYICVAAHDQGATIGLLLWKVRQVFRTFPREYQFLVADDGSRDATGEVLELYQRVLPLTVLRHDRPRGYAASLEGLLGEALQRTDRPRRDAAVVLPANFSVSPEALPDLVRRLESGADLVIGELVDRREPVPLRLVRRSAPWLFRPRVSLPGLRDFLSGCYAVRLATLKRAAHHQGPWLVTDGWCANAELIARAALHARQIAAVPVVPGRARGASPPALALALAVLRARRQLRIPPPSVPVERFA